MIKTLASFAGAFALYTCITAQHRTKTETPVPAAFTLEDVDMARMHIGHGYVFCVADPEGEYANPLFRQPVVNFENLGKGISHYRKALELLDPENLGHKIYIEAAYRGMMHCYMSRGDVVGAEQARDELRNFQATYSPDRR